MAKTKKTLTVFTPAYNRAHTLGRTYNSLCRQTSKDFKWVIVDDGSTDNTEGLVKPWLEANNGFEIEYYNKENGGMHTAHNEAYKHIDTELAVCIDSDDWMPDNGVEIIIDRWEKYGCDKYAGMIGLDIFEDGYVVGTCFPKGLHECKTYELSWKYGVICDKKYVYRTDVIKEYLPYPEFEGEKYGQVNWLYQVIDKDYSMLCSNDIYCIVDYQVDGLSFDAYNQHKQSPRTRAYECNELLEYYPVFRYRIKHAIQYDSSVIFLREWSLFFKSRIPWLTVLLIPIGFLYNAYLQRKRMKKIDINKIKFIHYSQL